jgi:hypothetical protein
VVADPHGWNSWQSYRAAHESKLAQYADHFLIEDQLPYAISPELVYWDGQLICADGIEIHVHRAQEVGDKRGRRWVRTTFYSYHVMLRFAEGVVDLFRYDNIGNHLSLGHLDQHHVHRFDALGKETIEHVGYDRWPTLGDVMDEAYDFWVRRFGRS